MDQAKAQEAQERAELEQFERDQAEQRARVRARYGLDGSVDSAR